MGIEYLLIGLEAFLLSFLAFRLTKIAKLYKLLGKEKAFPEKITIVLNKTFNREVAAILTREILMLYYLFARRAGKENTAVETFTYHKTVGYKGLFIALLSVIILESAGLFVLLHGWLPVLSWVHLGLNIYGVFYLVSDYRAITSLPILISEKELHISLGSRRHITIPLNKIGPISDGRTYPDTKKQKDIFKAVLIEFDTPQFEIQLTESVIIKNFLGRDQEISRLYVSVDDKERFQRILLAKVGCYRMNKSKNGPY